MLDCYLGQGFIFIYVLQREKESEPSPAVTEHSFIFNRRAFVRRNNLILNVKYTNWSLERESALSWAAGVESHTGEICTVVRFLPRVNHQSYFFPGSAALVSHSAVERAPISQEMDLSDIPIEFRFAVRA